MKGEGLNNEAVKQRLNALKDKINKNEWNIHFQNAEHGSLILNVVVYNSVFYGNSTLVDQLKLFVERIFSSFDETCVKNYTEPAERQKNLRQQKFFVECMFVRSDYMEEGNTLHILIIYSRSCFKKTLSYKYTKNI